MSSETAREPEGPGTARSSEEPAVVDAGERADTSGQVPVLRAGDRPQPPRPEVGGARFVATSAPPVMPRAVSTGLSLWVGSLASGLLAAGSIVRSQPALRDRFAAEVMKENPSTTLGTAQDAASVLVWVVVGGLTIVWLVHLVLVVRTARGHGGARWALVVLGILGAAAVVLVQAIVADPDASTVHDLNRLALLAQAGLALAGSLVLASSAAGRWFRELRRGR
ncbi:hypothetical protein [Cellulomonas sp. URHE0023]|uniref:hypothetical protein n=1 Tax=Cellulomonas sp. URHE0023 TaxID=1380354 RepID=UPI0012DEEC57|nr:hypothetical protein [Cellulomonas sp. URHE0023]